MFTGRENKLPLALAVSCLLAISSLTQASLIGGTVRATSGSDTGEGFNEGRIHIVGPITSDASDVVDLLNLPTLPHNVDFDAFSFVLTIASTGWGGGSPFLFNGYRFDQFDWQGTPQMITGVSVTDNIAGFNAGNVSYSADEIWLDFQGLSTNNSIVEVTIQTQEVPEPSSMALFGLGVMALIRRRRSA